MDRVVRVRKGVLNRMLEEARRSEDVECCGLLAGRDGEITEVLPAANMLNSPTAYEIAPAELFKLFRAMRAASLEHLGIYHSHPRGPNVPSPRDVEGAYYPDAAWFIISPAAHVRQSVRAFSIGDGRFAELRIESF